MPTSEDLKILKALPLDVKIKKSALRIKEFYNYYNGNVYIAYSGGKDSTVLKHLVHSIYPNVPTVFCDTGVEFKGVREKGLESDYILKPELDFVNIIRNYGYPVISKQVSHNAQIAKNKPNGKLAKRYFSGELKGSRFDMTRYRWLIDAPFKVTDRCCNIMKKNPSHKFSKNFDVYAFVGTQTDESQLRLNRWLHTGCNSFDSSNPSSAPLSFWTEQDILEYIKRYELDIASEYGSVIENNGIFSTTGEKRTGCLFCLFGIKNDTDRFIRLKNYDERLYNYVMYGGAFNNGIWMPDYDKEGRFGLGFKFVIDWLNDNGKCGIKY